MAEACTGVICSNFMEESTPRIHGDKAGRSWDQAPAAMGAGDASVGMPTRCRKMKKKLQVEKAHRPCRRRDPRRQRFRAPPSPFFSGACAASGPPNIGCQDDTLI